MNVTACALTLPFRPRLVDVQPLQPIGCAIFLPKEHAAHSGSHTAFDLLPFLIRGQYELIKPMQHAYLFDPDANSLPGIVCLK